MTSRFQLVPAAYIIMLRPAAETGQEVLLQLRRNTGYYDGHWACAAAGHVEAGETALEAAVREAREEAGITVQRADLVPVTVMQRTHGNPRNAVDERVDFFFSCRQWQGTPRRCEPEKSADLQWWSLANLPQPLVPHEGAVLRSLHSGSLSPLTFFGFPGEPPGAGVVR